MVHHLEVSEYKPDLTKANEVINQIRAQEKEILPIVKVTSLAHALSEEVLKFCVGELRDGASWNSLRMKLGLRDATQSHIWRQLKDVLCSSVMPENEEQAYLAMAHHTQDMVSRIEGVLDELDVRVKESYGTKMEPMMFRAQLDAMKLHMEAQQKKFEHFIAMRALKLEDRKKSGASIIYQQNFLVPRPGNKVEWIDGKPVIKTERDVEEVKE